MNLLFDIDSTITKETEFVIKYAPKYLKKKFGCDFPVVNPNGYDVSEIFNLRAYLEENPSNNIETDLQKINSNFWNKYFVRYMFYPLKDDVSKTIKALKKEGHNIYFASLRGKKTHENETFIQKNIRTKIVPFLTKLQFKINRVQYDRLILVEKNEDKVKIASDLQVSFLFDDQVEVLKKLDDSVKPICIEAPHNINIDLTDSKIHRISFDYKNINLVINTSQNYNKHNSEITQTQTRTKKKKNKKRIKNLKIYQKIYTETFYKIARKVGKNYVIKHYNPIIFGEENIPKNKEATVFVSNHRNIKDPLIMIALLKNPTHFAALQRMFEYNENMFGPVGKNIGTFFTTVLVHSMGCLPVARPTDENYQLINLQTFKYIDEYLKMGSSIGIFPEGTLNRNPAENGNILPLKSNRSFKLAELGKAVIVPTSIIWIPKEIGIKNKVVVAFLEPIYTDKLKSDEISRRWESSVNSSISLVNQMIQNMAEISEISGNTEKNKGKIKEIIR